MVGREKIYIIDEAQRLSREAFDALLKLFEEPPPGVRFVLATTEPHKMPATIVGRCQRFDFRRLTIEDLSEHLVDDREGRGRRARPGRRATRWRDRRRARRATRCRCWTRRRWSAAATVDEAVVRSLLGAPQGEIRIEIADVVAVGDLRGAFEAVDRLVQAGHDLRNVTGDLLAHFRNLLLVQTAPDQEDLLDIPADAYSALRAQAEKFTPAELSRVLDLLLAAQNDMRWTTSPRLTLELALVRACAPETDPTPAGVVARLERLERLANVAPARPAPAGTPSARAGARAEPPQAARELPTKRREAGDDPSESQVPPLEARSSPSPGRRGRAPSFPVPHAADAASVDVAMLRRSWGSLVQHLGQPTSRCCARLMESATPTSFDGTTLELAFPPTFRNTVKQVESREDALAPGDPASCSASRRRSRASSASPAPATTPAASSRSRRTTRPPTMPRRCAGCRRCSAPNRSTGREGVYEGPIQELIDELARLPGVGPKSAQRLAFWLIKAPDDDARRLAAAIVLGEGAHRVLPRMRQRRRGRPVPDLPRREPRPHGARASSRNRRTPRRSRRARCTRAATTSWAGRSARSTAWAPRTSACRNCSSGCERDHVDRVHPRHEPEPRRQRHRDVRRRAAQADRRPRHAAGERAARSAATSSTPTRSRCPRPSRGGGRCERTARRRAKSPTARSCSTRWCVAPRSS